MSLIPALEIGVWNAWILTIWLITPIFLEPLNIIPKGREEGDDYTTKFNKIQKIALLSGHIVYLLVIIYSIFVPLKLGTVWFYVGLPIYLLGLISQAMVWVGFATTPPNKPGHWPQTLSTPLRLGCLAHRLLANRNAFLPKNHLYQSR